MAASVGTDIVEIAADQGIFREHPARLAELLVAALPLTFYLVSTWRTTGSAQRLARYARYGRGVAQGANDGAGTPVRPPLRAGSPCATEGRAKRARDPRSEDWGPAEAAGG
jgi:hypothetical protein